MTTMLTLDEVKEKLQIKDTTIRRLIKEEGLPAYKIGGAYRIKESELEAWINSKAVLL